MNSKERVLAYNHTSSMSVNNVSVEVYKANKEKTGVPTHSDRSAEENHDILFALFRTEVEKDKNLFLDKPYDKAIKHVHLYSMVLNILTPDLVVPDNMLRFKQCLIDFHADMVLLEGF